MIDGGKPDLVLHWPLAFILRPSELEGQRSIFFAPLGGIAVCAALRQGWRLPAEIKWPNDILIHRKKVCGILAETSWDGSKVGAVILGIGINVAHDFHTAG